MGSEAESADSVLDDFRRSHPDIPVRLQRVPWSAAHEKLLTRFRRGIVAFEETHAGGVNAILIVSVIERRLIAY